MMNTSMQREAYEEQKEETLMELEEGGDTCISYPPSHLPKLRLAAPLNVDWFQQKTYEYLLNQTFFGMDVTDEGVSKYYGVVEESSKSFRWLWQAHQTYILQDERTNIRYIIIGEPSRDIVTLLPGLLTEFGLHHKMVVWTFGEAAEWVMQLMRHLKVETHIWHPLRSVSYCRATTAIVCPCAGYDIYIYVEKHQDTLEQAEYMTRGFNHIYTKNENNFFEHVETRPTTVFEGND